jgi:L-lactate dehydrogenase (cytochrome)
VAVKRQIPRWRNVKPLLGLHRPTLRRGKLAIKRALTISDLACIAKHRVPNSVFDYVAGAALDELSFSRARGAFDSIEFQPRVLRDVSNVDASSTIFGQRSELPLILAPTGYTRMMHHIGEPAVARAAEKFGVPYCLSTMGTTSIEDLAAEVPGVRRWFQLYLWRDRVQSNAFVIRAREGGYDVLVLTVDTPVSGMRLRDTRNGLTVPPKIRPSTFFDMALHVPWWFNLLTTAPLEFATFKNYNKSLSELAGQVFDPSVTMSDIAWLRDTWTGSLIVKGVQTIADAILLADLGVDGIIISNHGGRQLDRGTAPLEMLPAFVAAVGDRLDVFIDGGVMSGGDVLAAVAMGAKGVLVGRAYLYGLMAGGQTGVERSLEIFRDEILNTMKLLGVASLAELNPDFAKFHLPRHPDHSHN